MLKGECVLSLGLSLEILQIVALLLKVIIQSQRWGIYDRESIIPNRCRRLISILKFRSDTLLTIKSFVFKYLTKNKFIPITREHKK